MGADCPGGSTRLTDQGSVLQHTAAVVSAKSYMCPVCGRALSSPGSLGRHLLIHSEDQRSNCAVCGARFTSHATFNRSAGHLSLLCWEQITGCEFCFLKSKRRLGIGNAQAADACSLEVPVRRLGNVPIPPHTPKESEFPFLFPSEYLQLESDVGSSKNTHDKAWRKKL